MDDEFLVKLGVDMRQFKQSLNAAMDLVENLSEAFTQLSKTKVALNVNIKNTDFNSVFKRLNDYMKTSNASAKQLSEEFDELFSGKAFQKGFQQTFNSLNEAIKKTGETIEQVFGSGKGQKTNFSRVLERSIAEAIESGMAKGIENALSRKRSLKQQFAGAVEDVGEEITKDRLKEVEVKIKTTENTFKNIENGIASSIANGLKKVKELGLQDGWSSKDYALFISANEQNLSKSARNWSQKEWAQRLGKEAAQSYVREMKSEEGANSVEAIKTFTKELNKIAASFAKMPQRLEEAVERTEAIVEARTREAKAKADIAEKRRDDFLRNRELREQKALVRQQNYYRDVKTATNMYRAEYAANDKTAAAQRSYIQAISHIRTLNEQAKLGNYPTLNTLISAQNQRQKASINLNNRLLSEQLGIDELNKKIKATSKTFADWGSHINKVANIMMNINQAMGNIQNIARNITYTILNQARSITYRLSSTIKSMLSDATEAYKSLETSMIGFANFFGEKRAEALYQQIKQIAAVAPGLDTTDLAEYVRQVAPVSGGDEQLALNASMGMLKTIQYGGAQGSTEMEYVIKNIRDVLSKGTATQIDIRQFNRAMPILESVLEDIGESQLVKDGKLTIDKNNVDTILTAFAKLNTDEQSKVASIFETMNKTLTGQWEQLTEQFRTNLMQMLKDSGTYGLAQNLLSQFNAGEYAGTALIRFGRALKNFIENINWFKIQRYGEIISEGLGIIGNAIKEMAQKIFKTIEGTDFRGMVVNWSEKLAGFIKSLGNGISQIIRLFERLGRSSLVGAILRLAPVTAVILKFNQAIMTFSQNVTKALGSLTQLLSTRVTNQMSALLKTRTGIIESIPSAVKASSINQRVGKDEAGNTVVLGQDYEGFSGTGVIQVIDKEGNVSKREFANYSNAEKEFASTATEITKEAGKFQKASVKVAKGLIKTANGIIVGINGLAITESISNVVESMEFFGESATLVASIVRTAGYALTGAIAGKTIGGMAGGVVGALVGLGVGIASLVKTMKEEEERLTNRRFEKALTEGQQKILNEVEKGLISSGYMAKDISQRTDEENYALQQVARTLSNTGMNDLTNKLEKDPNYLYRVFADALVYKNIGMNSTGQNSGEGFDWNKYEAAPGRGVNIQTDRETMSRMAKLIAKYDLAADQGWYRDEQGRYHTTSDTSSTTNLVSGEEIWKAYFGEEEVTKKGVEEFEKYLKDQEKRYSTLKDVDAKTEEIKSNITKLTGNTAETFLDNTTDSILTEVKKANSTLIQIASQSPTSETNAGLFANERRSAEDIKTNLNAIQERYNKDYYGWMAMQHKFAYTDVSVQDPKEIDSGAKYNADYDINKIYQKVSMLSASDKIDETGKNLAEQFLNDIASGNYDKENNAKYYMRWINEWRNKLTKYFVKAGLEGFASGGSVLSRGIDTVPAMLSPGEFVMKQSAVKKAGLGVMYALNHGDLGMAARRLAGNVNNNWYRNNNSQINNSRNQRTNINNITINNRSNSGRLNSYYSLANRLSF